MYNKAILESQAPAMPTVIGAPAVTASTPLPLRGTKEANTSIWISGQKKVDLSADLGWDTQVNLNPGSNLLSIVARNADGIESSPLILPIILDNVAPTVVQKTPAEGALLNQPNPTVSFKLQDAYSALDLAATTANASVTVNGQPVPGTWSSSGSDTVVFTFITPPAGASTDGAYMATIHPTDALGNSSLASLSFTVDATPPAAPTINAPAGPVQGTVMLTGTRSADSNSVMVTNTRGTVSAATYPSATTWQVTLSGLTEGEATVSAFAADAAGNRSETVSATLTVDVTPPTAPTVDEFASPVAASSLTLAGGKEADSSLYINDQEYPDAFAATSWSAQVALNEGSNTFTLYAKDAAGNPSPTTSVTIVRDTTAPVIATSTPNADAVTTASGTISVTLADSNSGVDLSASLAGATVKVADGAVVDGTWVIDGAALVFTSDAPLFDGNYTVTLSPADTLGNTGTAAFSFTVDSSAPSATSLTLNPVSPVKAETVKFTLTFDEAMDTTADQVVALTGPGLPARTYTVSGAPAYPYALYDPFSGDEGEAPNPSFWTPFTATHVDPFIGISGDRLKTSFTSQPTTGSMGVRSKFKIRGDFEAEVAFEILDFDTQWDTRLVLRLYASGLTLDNRVNYLGRDMYQMHQVDSGGASDWHYDFPRSFQHGRLKVRRQGKTIHYYYADGDSQNFVLMRSRTATNADQDVAVELHLAGNYPVNTLDVRWDDFKVISGEIVGLGEVPNRGSWLSPTKWQGEITFTPESGDGEYTVSVSGARDVAGNIMTEQTVGSFVLDTIAPVVPTVAGVTSPVAATSILLSGEKEADSALFINGQELAGAFAETMWSTPVPLTEGPNTFTLYARDAAGNRSDTTTVTVVRDTTAPSISASTPSVGSVATSVGTIVVTLTDSLSAVDLAASLSGATVKTGSGTVVAGTWAVVGETLVFTPDAPLSDNAYTVTLKPVDTLGNTGSASFGFTVDSSAPSATALAMSPDSPHRAETVTFTLAFSEAMNTAVAPTVKAVREGLIFDTAYDLKGSWQSATTWRGTYAFTAASGDGDYRVTVAGAKDIAGNAMAAQTAGSFALDTTAPAAPTLNGVTTPTKLATQILTGAKEAGTALLINGQQKVALNAETAWSVSYPLQEGANPLAIIARDAAGNESPLAAATAILLDTVPPLFTVDVYNPRAATATQTLSGSKEPGCTVMLDGQTIIGPENLSTTWSRDVTLVEGILTRLTFSAADALGNTTTRTVDLLFDAAAPPALGAGVLQADGSGKGSEVRLTWPTYPEPADLAYYRIYVAESDFSTLSGRTAVGTANKGNKAFTVGVLTEGTTYFFAVEPVDVSGNSEMTVQTASAVPTDAAPPEEVTGLKAVAGFNAEGGNAVTLTWAPSLDSRGDLAEQVLYVDAGTGYGAGTSLGKTAVSRTVTGLADATLYKFKVTTKDTGGHESAGTVVQAVTRLANPTGLAATAGKNQVALRWNALSSGYLKEYRVYRLASEPPLTEVVGLTPVKALTGTTWTDTGLVNGTTYQYAVTAVNTSGAERTQVASVAATPRQDADGPVVGSFNLAAGQVIAAPLTVEASASDAESAMAKVELYLDGLLVATGNGSSVSWYWNVVEATDGNHTIKVVAYDALGNATEASRAVVVSLAPPATPQITSHTVESAASVYTVKASGSAPLYTTVTLRVNGTVVGTSPVSGTGFSFSGLALTEGENRLAVKASHRGGESPWSADYRITVDTGAPAAPTALAAQALAGGTVQFSWQAGAGETPTGYNLYASANTFSAVSETGVSKVNSSPIGYLFKEIIPANDAERHYAVTALDGAGNESGLSNLVAIASDRSVPTVAVVTFAAGGGAPTTSLTTGPATVQVALTVSEPLKELPFFSLEPQVGSPIVVAMSKVDDLHYAGSFRVDATSPHGPSTWKFSGKDVIGNRGSQQGAGPVLDVRGPAATVNAPSGLQQIAAAVPVAVTFDEDAVGSPALEFRDAVGAAVPVTGFVQTTDARHWAGTVDLSALAEGEGSFRLLEATDGFGNVSSTVAAGAKLLLYKDAPPAPAVPLGLTAQAKAGGRIELLWKAVTGATSYKLYRRAEGEGSFTLLATQTATGYADLPELEGRYAYAVSAVGLLDSESDLSAEVWATCDRSAPTAPAGLALVLEGAGVKATWSAPQGDAPASYRLYRAGAAFTSTSGLTAVATSAAPEATDAAPSSTLRQYAVTALDALGNESAPSPSVSIDFPVAPVKNLVLTQLEGGKPSLTWEAPQGGLAGYFIYRNGQKVNAAPTPGTSYTDGYYSGGSVTYGISALDGFGNESPVRELTLPDLVIALPEGTTLRRGLLETVPVVLTSSADSTVKEIRLKVGSSAESVLPGPFALAAGLPLTAQKVVTTPLDAGATVAVIGTAVIEPALGTTLRIIRTSLAHVAPSGSALEIFSEPIVRGTSAQVRLKVNNLGSARMDFVTSENGGATGQVRLYLKDQDGNVLAEGRLDQRTGSQVVNSGSYATARIEPGASFLSEPIVFAVPASAPYAVVLEAVIAGTWYHYKLPDQVAAPGMRQSVPATIADVSYGAVARAEKDLYKQGEAVVITGQAISTATGEPMPNVPVRLGLSIGGFDRFFTVSTDAAGSFRYTYQPASNEAGHYSLWAVHPDLKSRSVQDEFDILAMTVSPASFNLKLAKGSSYDIAVALKNYSGAPLTGVTFTASVSDGLTATVLNSFDTLAGNQTRSVTLRVSAAAGAPGTGYATLKVATDQGLSGRLDVNASLVSTIPIISTSPSYIDTGLVRGTQRVVSFTVKNSGAATLDNARLTTPSTPWMSLTVPAELGSLAVGQSASVGVLLRPDATVPPGIYNDRIVITADNHIPYTVNLQATVTSDAVGSVVFDILNELFEDVAGATVNLQHQSLPELYYTLKTGADGTASRFDIPEGRYSFNVSATGHKPYSGSFVVTPGLTVTVPVALEVTLVEVEWSVTEITIEDRYEIKITQTFETNVPTSVLVVEPAGINLPAMAPGEVFNGEFTITNYGLIQAEFKGLNYPRSFDDFDMEVLGNIPATLGAYEKIIVPYRITRRAQQ